MMVSIPPEEEVKQPSMKSGLGYSRIIVKGDSQHG